MFNRSPGREWFGIPVRLQFSPPFSTIENKITGHAQDFPLIRSSFILIVSMAGFVAHAQDSLDFTRFKWGTPLSIMQDRFTLTPIKTKGVTWRYASNVSFIGGVSIDDCQFEFTNGEFSGIAATTPGKKDSQELVAWLMTRFGPGENREPLGWQWFQNDTHVWFDMARSGEGFLYWYSLKLQPAREK